MSKRRARAFRRLDQIYQELPGLECQGKCAESCGPIGMGPAEQTRIGPVGFDADLTCDRLKDERCTIYAIRPMICRLWGLVESMPCEWGCQPTRYLTREEGFAFLRRADGVAV